MRGPTDSVYVRSVPVQSLQFVLWHPYVQDYHLVRFIHYSSEVVGIVSVPGHSEKRHVLGFKNNGGVLELSEVEMSDRSVQSC